jgi:hypothetical protein
VQKVVTPVLLGRQANLDREPARGAVGGADATAMRLDHPVSDRKAESMSGSSPCGRAAAFSAWRRERIGFETYQAHGLLLKKLIALAHHSLNP